MICYIFNIIDLLVCYPFRSCIYHSEKSISNCMGNDSNDSNDSNDNHGNDVSVGRDSGIQSTSIEMGRASPHNLKVKRNKSHAPKHINTMNEKMIDTMNEKMIDNTMNDKKINENYDEITGDDLTFTHSINSDSDDDYILPDQFIDSQQ